MSDMGLDLSWPSWLDSKGGKKAGLNLSKIKQGLPQFSLPLSMLSCHLLPIAFSMEPKSFCRYFGGMHFSEP